MYERERGRETSGWGERDRNRDHGRMKEGHTQMDRDKRREGASGEQGRYLM